MHFEPINKEHIQGAENMFKLIKSVLKGSLIMCQKYLIVLNMASLGSVEMCTFQFNNDLHKFFTCSTNLW